MLGPLRDMPNFPIVYYPGPIMIGDFLLLRFRHSKQRKRGFRNLLILNFDGVTFVLVKDNKRAARVGRRLIQGNIDINEGP